MKKLLLLLFVIPFFISSAQNIDSLYNEFLRIRGINQNEKPRIASETGLPVKCGFGIINQVKTNYDKFSSSQKKIISSLLLRPTMDTSFVSPKGWFRIHYDKKGYNAPGYDVNEIARAADSSYNYEVNFLGYPPPPGDAGAGGDDRYDIYIKYEGGGTYGGTTPDEQITDSTWTAYTDIDNNFGSNYYTQGINAARVTIAHEFHHAIQIGNYINRYDADGFYYELTSTSMEEFVYPSVDDYIQYIASYLRNPQQTFNNVNNSNNGYDLAIWNIFLRDRFGAGIIKHTWELMPAERALYAIADAIQQAESDFKTEFNLFGKWTYFTGVRDNGKYFKEASHYPLINPTEIASSITVSSQAVSNNFFKMYYFTSGGKDSVITLVTNSNIAGGIASPISTLPFTYTLSTSPITDGKKIAENFYSKLEPPSYILTETNLLSGNVMSAAIDYPFPQPFKYSVNNQIFIPTVKSDDGLVDLYIYSTGMNLVYSSRKRMVVSEPVVVIWDGRDNNNNKLSTGVYIYVTKSGETVKKGKLVIQND